jgi:hypothetical protein
MYSYNKKACGLQSHKIKRIKKNKKNYGLYLESLEEYRSMYGWMTLAQNSYLFFHSFSGDESDTITILMEISVQQPLPPCQSIPWPPQSSPNGGQSGLIGTAGQYMATCTPSCILPKIPGACEFFFLFLDFQSSKSASFFVIAVHVMIV